MAAEESIDERVDPDRLKRAHPSWRPFRAHPALGLEETEGNCVTAPGAGDLGVAWLALDLAEQRVRERDFLRALLHRAAGCAGARFTGGWWRGEAATADLARRSGASLDADGTACGSLTDEAVDALLSTPPQAVVVEAGEEMVLQFEGDSPSIGVWMDRWKALALERDLLDHVMDEARAREQHATDLDVRRRREVDRVFRAHVVVAWSRHGGKIALGALGLIALLGWHPLGNDGWADFAVLLVGLVAVTLGIGWLVDHWYRRTQSDSAS